jgi:uncharacterized protein
LASEQLAYGAAYTPYLRTALAVEYREDQVTVITPPIIEEEAAVDDQAAFDAALKGLSVSFTGAKDDVPKVEIKPGGKKGEVRIEIDEALGPKLTITLNGADKTAADVIIAWDLLSEKKGFELKAAQKDAIVAETSETALTLRVPAPQPPKHSDSPKLAALKASNTGLYNQVKAILAKQRVTLPPSGAVAGIYARVDRDRGVWKAPANVAVASVVDLTRIFTEAQQGGLNVDPTGGKSINAIRSFTGRGTLIWGARTLAGNDNEWRYVPVRRLFITIEESAKKASAFSAFEPNDATTWLKVKAMIDSYLYGLWERGALAGSRPETAYSVNVGLGKTMTTQDVLEGRMIVEIGIAAVRPSEFIILRFTHQLQAA